MARIPGWKKQDRTRYKTSWRHIRMPKTVSAERHGSTWLVKANSIVKEEKLFQGNNRSLAEIHALGFMRTHPEGV